MKKTPSTKISNKEIKQKERWHRAYQAPSTRKNPSRLWVLPEPDRLIDDLLSVGGREDLFLKKIASTEEKRIILYVQILDRLSKPDAFIHFDRWRRIATIGKSAAPSEIQNQGIFDSLVDPEMLVANLVDYTMDFSPAAS